MKLHRFYLPNQDLTQKMWIHDPKLLHQWQHVLRFRIGEELVLFDGERAERLYKIHKIADDEIGLELVTELVRQIPKREVYLFWSLLKHDNNDLVLQKATELGASHLVPIIADRSEKTGFNLERAEKIVIEAAEQCGRSNIPKVREEMTLKTALNEFNGKVDLFFAEKTEDKQEISKSEKPAGVFVGPEGGWSDDEKALLAKHCQELNLGDLTLRAETAAIVATAKLVQ